MLHTLDPCPLRPRGNSDRPADLHLKRREACLFQRVISTPSEVVPLAKSADSLGGF